MESVIILVYLLNGFFCYSICTDIQNYRKFQEKHEETIQILNNINNKLCKMETRMIELESDTK